VSSVQPKSDFSLDIVSVTYVRKSFGNPHFSRIIVARSGLLHKSDNMRPATSPASYFRCYPLLEFLYIDRLMRAWGPLQRTPIAHPHDSVILKMKKVNPKLENEARDDATLTTSEASRLTAYDSPQLEDSHKPLGAAGL